MELQARVTALEEEVGMLKGEIKSILQEVRVAVLARQNPFSESGFSEEQGIRNKEQAFAGKGSGPAGPVSASLWDDEQAVHTVPASSPEATLRVIESHLDEPFNPTVAGMDSPLLARRRAGEEVTPLDLAALLSWVQECCEHYSATDFAMMVEVGAYGGFVDDALKQTLLGLSKSQTTNESYKASLADFTLSLQKLAAIRDGKPLPPAPSPFIGRGSQADSKANGWLKAAG